MRSVARQATVASATLCKLGCSAQPHAASSRPRACRRSADGLRAGTIAPYAASEPRCAVALAPSPARRTEGAWQPWRSAHAAHASPSALRSPAQSASKSAVTSALSCACARSSSADSAVWGASAAACKGPPPPARGAQCVGSSSERISVAADDEPCAPPAAAAAAADEAATDEAAADEVAFAFASDDRRERECAWRSETLTRRASSRPACAGSCARPWKRRRTAVCSAKASASPGRGS